MIPASILNATPWSLEEEKLETEQVELHQTLFAQANGYVGIRGCVEEGYEDSVKSTEGTYLNGVYSREPIPYGESAHGFATHNQKMIQMPNGKFIEIFLDETQVRFGTKQVVSHKQKLDFKTGILTRETEYLIDEKYKVTIQIERFVSIEIKSLMVTKVQLAVDGFRGKLKVVSGLDSHYEQSARINDPRVTESSSTESIALLDAHADEGQCLMLHQVKGVDAQVVSVCAHARVSGLDYCGGSTINGRTCITYEADCDGRSEARFEKRVTYGHSTSSKDNLKSETLAQHKSNASLSYTDLVTWQQDCYNMFWASSDIELSGDDKLQQGLRFNQFHLFQSTGRSGESAIAAKGLTGHGYDGHYFWDTEIYIIPSLIYSQPKLARDLLAYRINTLESAKARARQMSLQHGALYAWRTIGGEECSAYYPASTAQYHINAAIAYAFKTYVDATGDWTLILDGGAEVIFETARLWPQLGHFNRRRHGQFCIDGVTGPDEYTAVVNNNFYTNAMAQMHLRFAVKVADRLAKNHAGQYKRFALANEEVISWRNISENMYLPFDDELSINPQDDQFLDKASWDFENTPKEKYPLLLHFHPLVIYRHQVLKQADVILAMFLLQDQFSDKLKRSNLAYYEPITTHDSTLSGCIYGIVNANVGQYEQAMQFLQDAARMDLDNLHYNTEYGVHTACMAGSWNTLVYGFAGMKLRDGVLAFSPVCPDKWCHYQFSIVIKGAQVTVSVTASGAEYKLAKGETLDIIHNGEKVHLIRNKSLFLRNKMEIRNHD